MTHISSLLKRTKGFILFVSTTLLSVSFLWSAPIDRNRAQQLAEKLFATVELRNAKQTSTSGDLRLTLAIPRDADLLHGSANLLRNAENKDPLIYVFERGNGEGFALIAGDDRLDSCIGYSLTGSFSLQNAPHSLRSFLATYLNYMENRLRSAETHQDPQKPIADFIRYLASKGTIHSQVEPLMNNILWDQGEPYNRLCPLVIKKQGSDEKVHAWVGCVATAMAQIMKHYEWPIQGKGDYGYTDSKSGTNHYVNFAKQKYDWAKMPKDTIGGYTEEEANELSKFNYHVAVSMNTAFSYEGSGAYDHDALQGAIRYFSYNKATELCYRDNYNGFEWLEALYTCLSNNTPVFYAGEGEEDGHAFVFDGYDPNGLFHVNWGWSGLANGYYNVNSLEPVDLGTGSGEGDYNYNQDALINLTPDKDGSSKYLGPKLITEFIKVALDANGVLKATEAGFYNQTYRSKFNGQYALAYLPVSLNDPKPIVVPSSLRESSVFGLIHNELSGAEPLNGVELPDGIYSINFVYRLSPEQEWKVMPTSYRGAVIPLVEIASGKTSILCNKEKQPLLKIIPGKDGNEIRHNVKSGTPGFLSVTLYNDGSKSVYAPATLTLKQGTDETKIAEKWVKIAPYAYAEVEFTWDSFPQTHGDFSLLLTTPSAQTTDYSFEVKLTTLTSAELSNPTDALKPITTPLNLRLSPNPVRKTATLYGANEGSSYRIVALNGKEITRGAIHSTTQLLDFSALEQGVYLLETEGQVLKFTLLP